MKKRKLCDWSNAKDSFGRKINYGECIFNRNGILSYCKRDRTLTIRFPLYMTITVKDFKDAKNLVEEILQKLYDDFYTEEK